MNTFRLLIKKIELNLFVNVPLNCMLLVKIEKPTMLQLQCLT